MNLKQFTRIVLPYTVIFVIAGAIMATLFWNDPLEWLQQIISVDGYWISLFLYALATIAAIVFAPLSIAVIVPFMAEIMGALPIFITTWISWLIGSVIAYAIARRWGKPLVGRLFSLKRIEKLEERMPKNMDFWVLVLLRIVVPADVLSYAVGLVSKISFPKYFFATALGIIPFTFIFSFGPKALTSGEEALLFAFFAVAGLILAALFIFYFSAYLRPTVWIYTHDGKFHADEVLAIAVLELVLKQQQRRYKVIRTRNQERIEFARKKARAGEEVYLIDIGDAYDPAYHLFDHHQFAGAGERANGIGYASLGLIWQHYGIRLCENNQDIVDEVDQQFIQAIDAEDNGQEIYNLNDLGISPITIQEVIGQYYNYSDKRNNYVQNSRFYDAVEWAKYLLPRIVEQAKYRVEQRRKAGRAYADAADKQMIVLREPIGRDYFSRFEDTRLIISPQGDTDSPTWGVATVPKTDYKFRGRLSFPRKWWGLRGEALEQASGIEGAIFCHRSGDFICIASTQEVAIKMAEETLKQAGMT
ncbi:MAG: MYG1 family protein [Patescibacteria group bacterium]